MKAMHNIGGAKDKPESIAARIFFRLAYAIHAAMIRNKGMMGYNQTAMTTAQASAVTPEPNAITERPAIRSHRTSDSTANNWEKIIQIRRPILLG